MSSDVDAALARPATLCAFCPKMCRSACAVSEAEKRETVTPWAKMALPNPAEVELPSMPRWQPPINQAREETRMNKSRVRQQVPASRSTVLAAHSQLYAEMGSDDN